MRYGFALPWLGLLALVIPGCSRPSNSEADQAVLIAGCSLDRWQAGEISVLENVPGGPLGADDLLIRESEFWRVYVLSRDQRYLGRSVVILKRHSPSLSDLTREEWDDLHATIRVMEAATGRAFGAVGFNWTAMMNRAFENDPPDPHVHLHFRPRYAEPVEFHGRKFVDEMFGNHYDREHAEVTVEMILAITSALRNSLNEVS